MFHRIDRQTNSDYSVLHRLVDLVQLSCERALRVSSENPLATMKTSTEHDEKLLWSSSSQTANDYSNVVSHPQHGKVFVCSFGGDFLSIQSQVFV